MINTITWDKLPKYNITVTEAPSVLISLGSDGSDPKPGWYYPYGTVNKASCKAGNLTMDVNTTSNLVMPIFWVSKKEGERYAIVPVTAVAAIKEMFGIPNLEDLQEYTVAALLNFCKSFIDASTG